MKLNFKHFFCFALLAVSFRLSAQRLILPGDYPDPSVVKIGDTYWASATTSNWMPAYPLLKSKDLINWETAGHVFDTKPEWADYYFWAPEISYENGKVYIYYSAHKRGGNLCVGVASADKPEGPYKDHGPLICQKDGSIDAFPFRDTDGKLYMIWKEDGNSVGKPTPNWIQEMNEERTALIGEKRELFRNDAAWEKNLVEGVSLMRHGGYIYAFYAGAGCCGTGCTYQGGVARAKSIFGPWEKYAKNPVLVNSGEWICPGHGTPIEKDGKFYFMYHAYNAHSRTFVGRQGMLIEFRFTPDGWVEFIEDKNAPANTIDAVSDKFNDEKLSDLWQWSVFQNFDKQLNKGKLELSALPVPAGAFLGQKTYQMHYDADVTLFSGRSDASGGIGLIGDEKNTVSAIVEGDTIKIIHVRNNQERQIASVPVKSRKKIQLRMQVRNGKDISFLYSRNGKKFTLLNEMPITDIYLPPWDRGLRVGLIAKGGEDEKAVFDNFKLVNKGGL